MTDYSAHISQITRNKDFDDKLVVADPFDEESKESQVVAGAGGAGGAVGGEGGSQRSPDSRLDGISESLQVLRQRLDNLNERISNSNPEASPAPSATELPSLTQEADTPTVSV